ncbi:tetratricopeptide repeat protein [Piscinibacter sakaiensis]|nr:tetratricopeptide repeat protein [Piscinibacter sakaiensis]
MSASLPRFRRAPVASAGLALALALAAGTAPAASRLAQAAAPAAAPAAAAGPVLNSPLDAPLFYQLLIGEIELRNGAAGTAYEVILDAARKQRNEQLFKRAADIALQARAGDQALAAARAWRAALPASIEAHRYVIQLLVAMNRPADTVEPLQSLIRLTPADDRAALIRSLPRFFATSTDRKTVPPLLERALEPWRAPAATQGAVLQALAGAWLAADDNERALRLARDAQALDPAAEAPAMIALQLLPRTPAAEALIEAHLKARPDNHAVRMWYARSLSGAQRYTEAAAQLQQLVQAAPDRAAAWLTLGALQVELKQPQAATASLQTYLRLADAAPPAAAAGGRDDEDDDGDATTAPAANDQARIQAFLLLAQAAEQAGDFRAAEAWLARVDNPQRALEVQQRRASLLAAQGQVDEARALIRQLPEKDAETARAKLFAEAQLLRDAKRWQEASDVLGRGAQRFANDVDLMYEQSMLAEKLGRFDEMEQLLRQVIALKPDHHHAHNALGYSLADRNLRLPEAKALIERALALSPGDPFITDSLGWVEYRLGNLAESVRLLRQAYAARPDTEIAAHLGEVLWVSGQTDEARRIWREARGRDAANDVLRETLARLRADL